MFESITKNFSGIIDRIRGKKFISEADLDGTMREIRIALLEADVSLDIVKNFIKQIKEQIVGREVIKNVEAGQMIVKIVSDELNKLFGDEVGELDLSNNPTIIVIIGLQGSGKTTTTAKLANRFKTKFNKKVLLVSLDVYRPAAQEQLETLSKMVGVDSLQIIKEQKPLDICKRAFNVKNEYDVIIFDTAGRLQVDKEMMQELINIKSFVNPNETILVADSLMGQEAVNVATEFNNQIKIDSIILTRIDSDGRGGATLSMKISTGCSVRYVGIGEKMNDIDIFHSKRIVSRILDMGDIVSLVEKAEELVSKEEAEDIENTLRSGNFDLETLLRQIRMMKKFGGITNILGFLPGAAKIKDLVKSKGFDNDEIKKQEAIILSMTRKERKNPDILNSSRKFRIAAGSGTKIQDINSFLKKFRNMKNITNKIGKMDNKQLSNIMKTFGDFDNENFS
jgi:signal recognition particle subunit SRP54